MQKSTSEQRIGESLDCPTRSLAFPLGADPAATHARSGRDHVPASMWPRPRIIDARLSFHFPYRALLATTERLTFCELHEDKTVV